MLKTGTAAALFETLHTMSVVDSQGRSPEKQLLDFCSTILGEVERLHFDFKEKTDRHTPQLSDSDKANLARSVSGFANSAGGVIIWGIEDETLAPKPIMEVARFAKDLLQLAPQVADPIVHGLDGFTIPADRGSGTGYAVFYVPESSLPPHQVILRGNLQHRYFVRTGSTFQPASHVQLEDMFGRRPRPQLHVGTRVLPMELFGDNLRLSIIVTISNQGRGSAKSPFLSLRLSSKYVQGRNGIDGNGSTGLRKLPTARDSSLLQYGGGNDTIIHPGMSLDVDSIELVYPRAVPPNLIPRLVIDHGLAADGIALTTGNLEIDGQTLYLQAEALRG